jgi:DNA-binding transcriptional regulator YhcF (GntR family)
MKLRLDHHGTIGIQQQIVREIEERIARGELCFGDRLPSSESLAQENGIHRLTVLAAYQELARKGRVRSFPRRGTLVYQTSEFVRNEIFRELMQSVLEKGKALGMTEREISAETASLRGPAEPVVEVERNTQPVWDLFAPASVQ